MPNQNPWRLKLKAERAALQAAYIAKPNPDKLLTRHAKLVDDIIIALAKQAALPECVAVLAVGGYGRGKLFPASDVDVLIAVPDAGVDADVEAAIEKFVTLLWDSGIEAGTSVRTIAQCLAESAKDVTVLTSLIEARPLYGNAQLTQALIDAIWTNLDVRQFFNLKIAEQQARHAKHQDVAMNLEPNIKESPGGLRDLHTVLWLSKAAKLGDTWNELAAQNIITVAEAKHLRHHERVLHDIRIRLHFLANRREDRLVFDYQEPLALMLGVTATKHKRASEALMQRYYLTAKAIWQLNTILLQNLSQKIKPPGTLKIKKLEAPYSHYAIVDGHLAALDETIFARDPIEIFRAFLLLQKHPEIPFFSPETLRALWRAAPKINKSVRDDPRTHEIFLEMLRSQRLTFVLRRMSRYSVLGRYLPAFGKITGQMQHDLFHVYTVDEHILMVVRNLRRFVLPRFAEQHRLCSELMQDFAHIEVLYLAALFHDIAKGRGGDHSELGTADATRFCKKIGLNQADTELVSWLVAMHLQMSATAQKQDLSDPEVIAQFCATVENERRLTALYLLTVADIRGTSPHVWNSWKAQLLEELFLSTRRALRQAASGEATNNAVLVEAKRTAALKLFTVAEHETELFVALSALTPLWRNLEDRYFQRFEVSEIAWHATSLWQHTDTEKAIVKARASTISDGVQVLVYTPDIGGLFARITAFFERLHLDIVAAKIASTNHGYALDTFQISPKIAPVKSAFSSKASAITIDVDALAGLVEQIERELTRDLRSTANAEVVKHRVSRQIRHTAFAPSVNIKALPVTNGGATPLFEIALSCADQPGLLSRIARFFLLHNIDLIEARVATLGARAEDIFIVRPMVNTASTGSAPTDMHALQKSLEAILVA